MAQITEFPVFPNIQAKQYMTMLSQLAGYLGRETPNFRTLRDQLRAWNVWDKAITQDVLQLILVPVDNKSAIEQGALLARLMEVDDEVGQHELMFQFFMDRNPLLLKTIYTALDTEQDGRIQSTNELYRIITSYVYPGDSINLPSFRGWIKWMESIEVIKLVGIRWGLGSTGLRNLEKIRQMDIDEILEDEEEGIPSEWDEAVGSSSNTASLPSQPASIAPSPAPATPQPETIDDDLEEDFPDMAPEAPIPDEDSIRAAEAALGIDQEAEDESSPPKAKPAKAASPKAAEKAPKPASAPKAAAKKPARKKSTKTRAADESVTRTSHIVLPSDTNALGGLFGGVLMSWMDICAAIAAQRHARATAVTASVDQLHFHLPLRKGDTVLLEAEVTGTGRTSMEILVTARRERLDQQSEPELMTHGYFTFVAIDENGAPVPVPSLSTKGKGQAQRQKRAAQRREARLQARNEARTVD